jgi:hypothetical protein
MSIRQTMGHYSTAEKLATPFPGICKRCGSADLFVKAQSVHLGLFCRDCGLWQQWISKSDARRFQADKVRLSGHVPISSPAVVAISQHASPTLQNPHNAGFESAAGRISDTPQVDVIARIERLERAFAGYDSQLGIIVKAILGCGVLQGTGGQPGVDVDDGLVSKFVEQLQADNGN